MFVGLFFQFDLSDDYEIQIYGITQNEIYYDKGELTIEEADSLADALEQTGYFDDYSTAYVEKKNNNYELFFSFDDSIFDDPTF
ncbi:hypothetical protein AGMMS49574_09910 [Bacteroidia bacterium]|nr:hypothetical protein AGMMS49574_09910 [Bacteroidia bacterium]